MGIKTCSKCEVEKPLAEFYFRKDRQRHFTVCKLCFKAQSEANYQKNRETKQAQHRAWDIANPDARREISARHYRENKDATVAKHKAWREANPERWHDLSRGTEQRSRARKAGVVCEDVLYSEIVARDGSRCGICGELVSKAEMSLDHIIPLKHKGPHTASNLQVAHRTCNFRKGAKLLEVTHS